jgi:hypothetical protein
MKGRRTVGHIARAVGDVAQCVGCGGVLLPAGDDWRHEEPAPACTELGTPVICHHGECGWPAAVGSLACQGHCGLSSSPQGVGSL